jgi:hypothetical protein
MRVSVPANRVPWQGEQMTTQIRIHSTSALFRLRYLHREQGLRRSRRSLSQLEHTASSDLLNKVMRKGQQRLLSRIRLRHTVPQAQYGRTGQPKTAA